LNNWLVGIAEEYFVGEIPRYNGLFYASMLMIRIISSGILKYEEVS
jgi:hypothetical protein